MQNDNDQLAQEIREKIEQAETLAGTVTDSAKQAIALAVEAGDLIDKAKFLHGNVGAWLLQNGVEIEDAKIKRFHTASKRVKALGGIEAIDSRQLLLFFGGEKEPEQKQEPVNRDPDNSAWLKNLSRFSEGFQKTLDHRPVSEWMEHEKELFRRVAEPIVKIYEEMK